MKNFLSVKDIVIIVALLATIGIVAVVVLTKMSDSVALAKEAKYASYVSQMRKMVDGANALNAFDKIITPDWVCLGAYGLTAGDFCWGDGNKNIINDSAVDSALGNVGAIPKGQMSPYGTIQNRGVIFKINKSSIEIKVYVGDTDKAKKMCSRLSMVQDLDDPLSCVLPAPIMKY